jgi:predicted RNase H-like nuclease (RuvC/YqgF family)
MDFEFIVNAVIAFVSSLAGYFFGSRKNNAETDSIVIENVKEILGVYNTTITDLKAEIAELREKIEKYEKHIEKLQEELSAFRTEMKK